MMTIIGSEYNPLDNAFEIYLSGCKRACPGCHNPEAQVFGKGKAWRTWLKENTYKLKTDLFKRVWILGGDLVGQPIPDAVEFLNSLNRALPPTTELWLWTGVESLKTVPREYKDFFDIIKTGSYMHKLGSIKADVYGDGSEYITLASSNQCFHNMEEGDA